MNEVRTTVPVKTARTTFAARKKTLCSDGMKRKKMA